MPVIRPATQYPAGSAELRPNIACGAWYLAAACLQVAIGGSVLADDLSANGQRIYLKTCAACHGAQGEGTADNYPHPLRGKRSVSELVEFISTSMPPDTEQKCAGDDAKSVAAFVYQSFYSAEAQAANPQPKPARNHLTTRQYQNAVADLIATFGTRSIKREDRQGLHATYKIFRSDGEEKPIMSRVDPEIQFDFGIQSPDPQRMSPREFSISWRGSILAPITGEYEFIIRCDNSFQLWVNDLAEPLIDRLVKSGDAHEHRGVVRLLGGRRYPVLLNFTKMGQGVIKPAEQRAKEKVAPAAITLSWIPPGRAEQVVASECFSPLQVGTSYVVATPFPPDDRSSGFERGSAVSKEWDRATTDGAIETADYITLRLAELSGVAEADLKHEPQLRTFCRQFAERAFRRPITEDQQTLYIDRLFDGAPDPETAVQRVILMVLKSPRFLYPGIGTQTLDSHSVASRLSFALWDAPPDGILLAAAGGHELSNREQIAAHAERMARDPRFQFKLKEFLLQWLKLDQARELRKPVDQFPGFDVDAARDLRISFELLLENVIASDDCDWRRLVLSDAIYLNGRLSKIYGGGLPEQAPFRPVSIETEQRAGILTHPYLMSVYADATTSSPIRRGVFIARDMLGRVLLPPPGQFAPLAAAQRPELTTRERITLQTRDSSCQGCHAIINSLGFTLEHFDAIGRYRAKDGGRPVDASGEYTALSDATVTFTGARELADYLAQSDEAHAAFVEKLFRFAVQQPLRAYGVATASRLKDGFRHSNFNMRQLFIETAIVCAMDSAESNSLGSDNRPAETGKGATAIERAPARRSVSFR